MTMKNKANSEDPYLCPDVQVQASLIGHHKSEDGLHYESNERVEAKDEGVTFVVDIQSQLSAE